MDTIARTGSTFAAVTAAGRAMAGWGLSGAQMKTSAATHSALLSLLAITRPEHQETVLEEARRRAQMFADAETYGFAVLEHGPLHAAYQSLYHDVAAGRLG